MPQKLTAMSIDKVALVDRGANGKRFAVFKRDDALDTVTAAAVPANVTAWKTEPAPETDHATKRGLLAKFAEFLGFTDPAPEPVAKVLTFASIVAGQEMTAALEDNFWTLSDALWLAVYAQDDDGADLSIEAKQALAGQNLDEFKAYLMGAMERGVAKRADVGPVETAVLGALVAKVGKKISAARLARLQEAADALTSVLAEVVAEEATEKRALPEEAPMTGEELAQVSKAVVEALEPRFAAIEKRLSVEDEELAKDAVAKAVSDGQGDIPEPIFAVLKDFKERLDERDQVASVRKSLDGQDGVAKAGRSWAHGIL